MPRHAALMRRYRCCEPGGCGWEGTLAATWTQTGPVRRRVREITRMRIVRLAKSRLVFTMLIGVSGIVLGAAGVKLYETFDLAALLARNGRPLPFGVSDFGRPLPANHPFLERHVDVPAPIVKADAAAMPTSAPASPPAGAVTKPAASADDVPLSLREDCAWGEPGRAPYKGTVRQALNAARLPKHVVALLERKIWDRDASDRLEIRNSKIRGVHSDVAFEPWAIKMTFARTLCLNSRVNFKPGHVEDADLYQVTDAHGTTYSVMIPDVCGNVSLLGPPVSRDDHPRDVLASKIEQARKDSTQSAPLTGAQGARKLGSSALRSDGNAVPEPETWTLIVSGVALLLCFTRRRRRGSRHG